MSNWDETTDDELAAELAAAIAEEAAVSERRREAAKAAFTWRTVDQELAELLHDSALDAGAAVRSTSTGTGTIRTLAFGTDGMTLELEVDLGYVLGQVIPEGAAAAPYGGSPAKVTLHRPSGVDQTVTGDERGFFRITAVAPGPVRFAVEVAGAKLITPWVTL